MYPNLDSYKVFLRMNDKWHLQVQHEVGKQWEGKTKGKIVKKNSMNQLYSK